MPRPKIVAAEGDLERDAFESWTSIISAEEAQNAVHLYEKDGWSVRRLAVKYGVCYSTMHRTLAKAGNKFRKPGRHS